MADQPAPLADAYDQELASFLRTGVAIMVATAGPEGEPECVRGWGLIPEPDERTLTVFIRAEHAGRTTRNLETNRRIAVSASLPTTYETYQLKGEVLGTRAGRDGDRPIVEMYREAFISETVAIGFTDELRKAEHWPVLALVVGVQQVFRQTPGVGSGTLIGAVE